MLQFEEEIARKKTTETAVSSEISQDPVENSVTTCQSVSPHLAVSLSASRPSSPLVVISQPVVVSSQPPVHVLRVLPRTGDAVNHTALPASPITIPGVFSSQPPRMSVTSSTASRFRPPSSTVTSFQAALHRPSLSSTTGLSSVQQLLSPSLTSAVHPTKSRLPFSSSSPNLVATGNKHVLIDGRTGQVITTVLPPAGNGWQYDEGKLRKNSSVASGIASVSY